MEPDIRGNLITYGKTLRICENGHVCKAVIAVGDKESAEILGILSDTADPRTGYYKFPHWPTRQIESPYCVLCGLDQQSNTSTPECLWESIVCPENEYLVKILSEVKEIRALLGILLNHTSATDNGNFP